MTNKIFSKAIVCSLGAHGVLLAALVVAGVNGVIPRRAIDDVPFIRASLIYAMNGKIEQQKIPVLKREARRQPLIQERPMEPVPSVDPAQKMEPQALSKAESAKVQTADRATDMPVSLHLPSFRGTEAREIASTGKTTGNREDLWQRSASLSEAPERFSKPRYLHAARPAYPLLARMRGYEGMVLLAVEVLADGRAGEIRLKRSSGYAMLDQSALDAVRTWRFEPARKKDMPLAMTVDIPIRFSLKETN
jgi:protein TonB